MKITDVRTVVVNAQMRNWVFVRVETSEPGLIGWGEASLEWKTRAVVGAVADFAPMLLGVQRPDPHGPGNGVRGVVGGRNRGQRSGDAPTADICFPRGATAPTRR